MLCSVQPGKEQQLHLMGIVEGFEEGLVLRVRFFIPSYGGNARFDFMKRAFNISGTQWYLWKLCGFSTIEREYAALQSCGNLRLMKTFLRGFQTGDEAAGGGHPREIPHGMAGHLEENYNESQLEAMRVAVDGRRISLIQGPPGTGTRACNL